MYIATNEALNNITDDSTFHQLACDVLKLTKPEYFCLENTGLNPKGKSIKSPLDSSGWIDNDNFICVEYTITENKGKQLENKWLEEKHFITKPDKLGDVVKSIKEINALRKDFPNAHYKIILCSNRKMSPSLDRKVRIYTKKYNVDIEVYWQDFFQGILDNAPDGQYIRQRYLGIIQDKLSNDLFTKICKENLIKYKKEQDGDISKLDNLVQREEFTHIYNTIFQNENNLTLLSGTSGQGKSILCYQLFKNQVENNNYALWVKPELINNSSSIEEIIGKTLHSENVNLGSDATSRALNLAKESPILLIFDDINSVSNTAKVLENIKNLSKIEPSKSNSNYQIICPVWSHFIEQEASEKTFNVARIGLMSDKESKQVIKTILQEKEITFEDSQINSLAFMLNNDPYLIGLLEDIEENISIKSVLEASGDILKSFIDKNLKQLSNTGEKFSFSEYKQNLLEMSYKLLSSKKLKLKIEDIKQDSVLDVDCLRAILQQRKICKINDEGYITFRHDRIRDYLFYVVISKNPNQNINVLTDPYYAEIIGKVIANTTIDNNVLNQISEKNPVALIKAVNYIKSIKASPLLTIILKAFDKFYVNLYPNTSLYNDMGEALFNIESEDFIKVLKEKFGEKMKGWAYSNWLLISLKYGDLLSGAIYCEKFVNIETKHLYLEEIINIGKYKIKDLKKDIVNLLVSPYANTFAKGILTIIGYLNMKDLDVCKQILQLWNKVEDKKNICIPCLWALLNSFDDIDYSLLIPVLDKLKAFSTKEQNGDNELGWAIDRLRLAYQYKGNDYLSDNGIKALINYVDNNKSLESNLRYIFNYIDNKYALDYVIRLSAQMTKKSKNSILEFMLTDHWNPDRKRNLLSKNTLKFLTQIWQNPREDNYVKKIAFLFWRTGATLQDLDEMKKIKKRSLFYNYAISTRIKLGDTSAVKPYMEINKNHHYILLQHCWNSETYCYIDKLLNHYDRKYYDISHLLMRISKLDAEKLLVDNWQKVSSEDAFIVTALYVGTKKTLTLAKNTLKDFKENKKLDVHLINHVGDNKLMFTEEFLKNLLPYFNKVDEKSFWHLALDYNLPGVNVSKPLVDELILQIPIEERKTYLPKTENDFNEELIFSLANKRKPHLKHFFQNSTNKGLTIEFNIIKVLEEWFNVNLTMDAFEIICSCLKQIGTRKDLRFLEQAKDKLIEALNPCPKAVIYNRVEDVEYYILRNNLE